MPRPSKHVSRDTLGGRIRAAREQLRLSLAEVADGHYSTSLISQIERNKVEPSEESLRFLAQRLQLPFEDLNFLAQQQREDTREDCPNGLYENLRIEASCLLASKNVCQAIELLKDVHFSQVPSLLRWRLAALRGQCYFAKRRFLQAQQDFMYAASEQPAPDMLPDDQKLELLLLHLHFAGALGELQLLDAAQEEYDVTLQMINAQTPSGYVAEAHWGNALVLFMQAQKMQQGGYAESCKQKCRGHKLRSALEHAENARFLYRSIGQQLRVAAVTCQIAKIERELGAVEKVRSYLQEVLSSWSYMLNEPPPTTSEQQREQQEGASVVSTAARSLALIELEAGNYAAALAYAEQALEAGERSYKLRRADAYSALGRILEAIHPDDPAVEEAFRHATQELADTDRIASRIDAHLRLGWHLVKIGKTTEGEQELEQAHLLSELVSASSSTNFVEDIIPA
jgi:transcriptional regulator with XRE-family HTH domain